MKSSLDRFLKAPENSVSREVLFAHRLTYELKVASAHWGWDLRVYRPDVDRDGFDLLVEQSSIARVLQLKTVQSGARTNRWTVRKHLLHPSRARARRLGFSLPKPGLGDGLDGAVVLVDFCLRDHSIDVSFRFFDLAVAAAHVCGLTGASDRTRESAERLINQLRTARGQGTVTLQAGLFLSVPTAEGLLAMLGMRTRYAGSWAYNVLDAYAAQHGHAATERVATAAEVRDLAVIALDEVQSGIPAPVA